jgi:hypothetical protein
MLRFFQGICRVLKGGTPLQIKPDMWILPEGLKIYLTNVRRENFDYYMAGPAGPEVFKSRGTAVDKANDCLIFEAKQFEIPNEPRPIDVLQRRAVIGEYYTMQNHLRGTIRPELYTSRMRDIFVYNEDKDGFSRITLDAALDNCCRFHMQDDGRLDWDKAIKPGEWKGEGPFSPGSDGVPKDMFAHVHDGELQVTRYFGDMHTSHLREDGLQDWCDSVIAKLGASQTADGRKAGFDEYALKDGAALCEELNSLKDGNEGVENEYFTAWLYLMHATRPANVDWESDWNIPRIPVKSDVDEMWAKEVSTDVVYNEWKTEGAGAGWQQRRHFTLEIFHPDTAQGCVMFGTDGKAKFRPIGYGNYAGLLMLSDSKYALTFPDIQPRAKAFIAAFEDLYKQLQMRFADSVLLDKAFQPPWLFRQDGRQTLFANVIRPQDKPLEFVIRTFDADNTKLDLTFPRLSVKPDYPAGQPWAVTVMTTDDKRAAIQPTLGENLQAWVVQHLVNKININAKIKAPSPDDQRATAMWNDIENLNSNSPLEDKAAGSKKSLRAVLESLLKLEMEATIEEMGFINTSVERVKKMVRLFPQLFKEILPWLLKSIYAYRANSAMGDELDRIVNLHHLLSDDCASSAATPYHALVSVLAIFQLATQKPGGDPKDQNDAEFVVSQFIKAAKFCDEKLKALRFGGLIEAHVDMLKADPLEKGSGEALWKSMSVPNNPAASTEGAFHESDDPNIVTKTIKLDATHRERALIRFVDNGKSVVQTHLSLCSAPPSDATTKKVWSAVHVHKDRSIETVTGWKSAVAAPVLFGSASHGWAASRHGSRMGGDMDEEATMGTAARFGAHFSMAPERAKRLRAANGWTSAEDGGRRNEALGKKGEEGFLEISDTLEGRWRELRRRDGLLTQAVKLAFLLAPVNGLSLRALLRKNDVFPFGFVLFRPAMTYLMGSGILTQSGARTGETLIGHADFQLADNVVQKMHIGNFTMYLKSVVYQQQNVYIAENIYAQGYLHGNNTDWFTKADVNKFMPKETVGRQKSMYACLVPYEGPGSSEGEYFLNEYPNPLDVTGSYSPSNPALAEFGNLPGLHYASAPYYADLHKWTNARTDPMESGFNSYNRYNTLCFQGHQAMFNPGSQNYDLVQANTGHWGSRVYAGCGKVRKGLQKMLEPVQYTSVHGGDAGRAMVTLGY